MDEKNITVDHVPTLARILSECCLRLVQLASKYLKHLNGISQLAVQCMPERSRSINCELKDDPAARALKRVVMLYRLKRSKLYNHCAELYAGFLSYNIVDVVVDVHVGYRYEFGYMLKPPFAESDIIEFVLELQDFAQDLCV